MAIYTKRMSHQNTIVDFMANKSYTGVFADYGSGKTLCALSYIEYMAFTRILVISTKTSIESTWVDEIVTHSNFKYTLLLGNREKKLKLLQYGFRISQIKSGYYHSGHKSPIIFLLNFDGVKNIINELIACRFELVIVDECFVAGTKVLTNNGEKNIEDIKVGDMVYNATGLSRVRRIGNRKANNLVKVTLSNGRSFTCTYEHPIFTENGWECAGDIQNETTVYGKESVQELWKNTGCEESVVLERENLQLLLRREMESEDWWHMEQRYSNETGFTGEIEQNIKSYGSQTVNSRWKWRTNTSTTTNVIRQTRKRLDTGIQAQNESIRIRRLSSKSFQNRYSKPKVKDSSGNRWCEPYKSGDKESRYKKNRKIRVIRVESVKILEQRYTRKFQGMREDSVVVYNLEVENHPSFFVEGILVHNSTKCKSPRTQRTKLLWALGKMIPNRVIMTGFPVTENLADIYAQIKFLDYGKTLGNSYYSFLDTYFVKYGSAYLPKRKMIPILLGKIKPFCIRVTNKMLNLPPKLYKKIKIEPTEQQLKILEQLNSLFMVEFGKVKFDTQYIFALVAKSLQICDGFIQDQHGNREAVETNKDQVLLDLMDDINVRKNKLLIWCSYRYSVAKLEAMLGKLRIPTLTLTGVTKNVNAVVHEFQRSKTTNVLIAIQKKASASITLTSCRYAIYYSNMWSFDERGNSEARIYRKGSEIHPNVVYTDLITAGSVEEKVYECLRKKKSLVDLLKKEFHDMGGTIK